MPDEVIPDKLYAGKFKTVEDLENGYKSSATVFAENESLKQKVDELSKVPDVYQNPADLQVDQNRLTDIQARAREAGMTQAQYEKFLRNDKARVDKNQATFDQARKDVGEETMNMLNDYVAKHYPKNLQDGVLRTLIVNKEARAEALDHRQRLLSSSVPGVGQPAYTNYAVTPDDIQKAYKAKEKNPGDLKARQHYLNLVAQQAVQSKAS